MIISTKIAVVLKKMGSFILYRRYEKNAPAMCVAFKPHRTEVHLITEN